MRDHPQDHVTNSASRVKIIVRKDEFIPSRPWHADAVFPDGMVWKGWQSFFRSKKALIQNARAALDTAGMYDAEIVDA